ncbi:conserved protein of unknown function [Candidatus Promineifilum breve]|uniref:BrnT family toxin n=1 Tax=Candidatus Promineifilum breve TaxID=1806508 RepID=A0A160T5Z1_9CHLR|nr:BrnT family toxin [Candidatus Promineifilum breve]CUS04355.2 conserved protein of unknown function [Candidatus Promineifilum breve]
MKTEWDTRKADRNVRKHGVDFDEAATVFLNPLALIFTDEWHSEVEERELIIGHSGDGRLLVVCFTARGESVRIISARQATAKEQKGYEENALR